MSSPLDLFSNLDVVNNDGFVPAPGDVDSDGPVTEPAADPLPGGAPTCEVCGRAVEYSGRGRKPKFCFEHKPARGSKSASGPVTVRASKGDQARLDAIAGDLQQGAGELAGVLFPIAPVSAGTLVMQAPSAASALVRIAANYPRMLDGLETAAKAVPFLELGKFVAAMVMAGMVDMGRIEPVGLAAEYLKVSEAAREVGWSPPAGNAPGETSVAAPRGMFQPASTPPPSFKLVA